MRSKKAVLVGCNYPGSEFSLNGCVNDLLTMRLSLIERFGFSEEDIVVLIDTDEECTPPTGNNILGAMIELVRYAEPGDVLFFLFSGHGSRIPGECIVGSDGVMLTGKTMSGSSVTVIYNRGNSLETPNVWGLSSFHPNVSKHPPPPQCLGFCLLFTPRLLSRRAGSDVDATTAVDRTQKPRRCYVSTGRGTLLAFQLLIPVFTNDGSCDGVTRTMTQILLLLLAASPRLIRCSHGCRPILLSLRRLLVP